MHIARQSDCSSGTLSVQHFSAQDLPVSSVQQHIERNTNSFTKFELPIQITHSAKHHHASTQPSNMELGFNTIVFIIILSAAASVVIGFATWRLCFYNPRDEDDRNPAYDMSDAQKEYLYSVRDGNRRAMLVENGVRM